MQKRHVIEALKHIEIIVDITVEGLIHSEEWEEIEKSGTRLFTICNEHPEILERTEPQAELQSKVELGIQMLNSATQMHVTSKAGTDLMIDLRWQYYGTDLADGLDHNAPSDKFNDWNAWLNFGYIKIF